MTEDELLDGITGALTAGGWRWYHVRRSDHALTMGWPGFPDIIALHAERRISLALELKTEHGRLQPGQAEWLEDCMAVGIEARIVRPAQYDSTWRWLVGDRLIGKGSAR
jgi:VRR-NUC domain-containing protein